MFSLKSDQLSWASLPLEIKLPIRRGTISEVQVDEALIRNAYILRDGLEVADTFFI